MFENVIRVLNAEGEGAVNLFKSKLRQLDPYSSIATGGLDAGAGYKVEISTDFITLLFEAPDEYYNPNTGKLWLEEGRLPGTKAPPKSVIDKWIVDRQIPARSKKTAQANGLVDPWVIQHAIRRDGIKPKPYIREIRQDLLAKGIEQKVNEALRLDIDEIIKKHSVI